MEWGMSLLLNHSRQNVRKKIWLLTADPSFREVLSALLGIWGYTLVSEADRESLLLAEDDLVVPAAYGGLIRLTRSRYLGRDSLPLPLPVEDLWASLEARFHRPPRNHIRIALDLPVAVSARGERETTRISSLSDLGTRFLLSRELVNQEPLTLEMTVDGIDYRLAGRVIYVVPRGEARGSNECEIGMMFLKPPAEVRTRLRDYVIFRYFDEVRSALPEGVFCDGLKAFELSPRVRGALGCS